MFQNLFLFLLGCYGTSTINIDEKYVENDKLFRLINPEYEITQKINNATFYLTISQDDIFKYIFLEIYFSYPRNGDINFITTIGINNLTRIDNSNFITAYADSYSYQAHKDYHFIIIPPYTLQTNDTLYITNLIINDRRSYQYLLKIRKLEQYPCPRNCSSQFGSCLNGICQCVENKIDLDCSKDAIPLKLDLINNFTVNGINYFFFQQETKLESIQFKMGLIDNFSSVQVMLDYILENFTYGLPVELTQNYTLSQSKSIIKVIIDISELNYNANLLRFNRVLFKVVTQQESQLFFEISNDSQYQSQVDATKILIITFSSLAGVGFIVVIVYFIKRYKNSIIINSQVIPQCQSESQKHTSLEILKKNLKQPSIEKQECSICLHNEKNGEYVLTPCQHVFHLVCLHLWLNKQKDDNSCPNCRASIDFQKIKIAQLHRLHPLIVNNSNNQSALNLNQEQAE